MEAPEKMTLASGRQVAVHWLAQQEGGRTIVFCHAAPGAGNFDPNPEETAKRPITLLAVDRPGYGNSEMVAGETWATVGAAADDLAEVLRQLKVEQVGVAGWSAGDRVAILATPAPDEEVPWIPPEQKQGLEFLRGKPAADVHAALAEQLGAMAPPDAPPEALLALLGHTPADEAALTSPGAAERLTTMLQTAFAQRMAGLAADIAGYTLQPWGFEPAEVKVKTLCLYGAQDPIAGSRHGSWWQKHLPNARLEMVPGAGHLLVIPMWKRVLSHLAPGK
jgi:pimeloyl-ACP methyl ester carboxylesterase